MCGSLRHEKKQYKIGQPVFCINPATHQEGKAIWSGFIRKERLTFWNQYGKIIPVWIQAESFFEKNCEFQVPTGQILAFGLKDNVFSLQGNLIAPAKTVRILTRPPISQTESDIHNRWPMVRSLTEPFIWTSDYMLTGQPSLFKEK